MDFPSRELCMEIVRKNFLQSQVAASRVIHALDGWSEVFWLQHFHMDFDSDSNVFFSCFAKRKHAFFHFQC